MSFPNMAAISWAAVDTEYVSTKTFRIGQFGMTEDGTLWRLAKAGAAMTDPIRAKVNDNTHLSGVTGDSGEGALVAAIVVGDVDFTFTDATNARVKDYWKDGIYLEPRASGNGTRHIWKSDAEVSDTYKIYVSSPFRVANDLGNTVHVYPNIYGNIQNPGSYSARYEQFAGAIQRLITSGYYFWLKVKGPHWFTVTGTWPGAAADDRDLVFHQDGTIKMRDESTNANQRAGYLIQSGNYGDVLTMLDLW